MSFENTAPATLRLLRHRLRLAGSLGLIVVALVTGQGIYWRYRDATTLQSWTETQAIPAVALVRPQIESLGPAVILPGNIEAFDQAPIYARVNGYLKRWIVDIGAEVKAGQILAEIDTPELDQQVEQATADVGEARANAELAEVTAKRWLALMATNSVSRQAADEKASDALAKKAALAARLANLHRLEAMEGFKKIVAPFDGIVTSRKTDVGTLIDAGSGSMPELFRVADIHKMRVYMEVPQGLANDLRTGMTADLILPEDPEHPRLATLVTTARAVNAESRTMQVELMVDNADKSLRPGTYAQLRFKLPADRHLLLIPTSALIFRSQGLQVATLTDGDRIALKPVTAGRDMGNLIEILSGLTDGDQVVDSPPDSIDDGDPVRIAGTSDRK